MMNVLWNLLLTLLVCHSQAVSEYFTDGSELQDCSSESCGTNLPPIPMVHAKKKWYRPESEAVSSELDVGDFLKKSNFCCHDKPYIPGIYADMEMNCKLFHICRKSLVEHFVCLHGWAFDQKTFTCKPEDEVQCHLSPTYYGRNANLPFDVALFPVKLLKRQNQIKWFIDSVESAIRADGDTPEFYFLKLLISLQLINVSDVPSGILDTESYGPDFRERAKKFVDSSQFKLILNRNLLKALHYAPLPREPDSTVQPKRVQRRSFDRGSSWVQISFDLLEPNGRRTVRIVELIVDVIAAISGRILSSRLDSAANYVQDLLQNISITRP